MSQTNDLASAFPEHKEQIHVLKATNGHFKRLNDEYEKLSKELHRIETGAETPEDAYVEQLKKLRLAVMDQLAHMLAEAA